MAVSLHEATLQAYKATSFDAVPASYVEDAWESNFCESVSLPSSELEDALLDVLAWRGVVENTREWSRGNQEEGSRIDQAQVSLFDGSCCSTAVAPVGFWTVLFDAGVSHKCLLAIIFALLDRDKPSIRDKMCAALSSQLYFILLQVPGTTAYKTFHPMIFQKALDTLLLYPVATDYYYSGGHTVRRRSSKSSSSGRRGKRRRSVRDEMIPEEEDEVFCSQQQQRRDDDSTPRDRELLKRYLKELIKELTHTLQHYSLKHHEVTRCQIITAMIRLTRLELPSSAAAAAGSLMDLSTLSTNTHCPAVHYLSWACLNVLCSPLHGVLDRIIAEVFHQLLPVITMVTDEEGVVSTLPLPLTIPSQHAVTFIRHLSSRTSGCASPLRTLVQHVCVRTPDRAEYRCRLAAIVGQLMSLFTHCDYSDMLLWIYKFSRNTKVCFRVFAMDIVSELMEQPLRVVSGREDQLLPAEAEYRLSYHYLVKMVLSRCSDRSPSVRAKALTCLSTAAGNHDNHQLIAAVSKAVFSLTATDPLLTTPSHIAPADDSIVMSMLQRRTSDNKVAVRKASLQALESLARLRRNGVLEQDVVAIHERCLDPALSVRKQAMVSLTSITMENKQCHMIYRLWLDGVLPMVMDPEVGAKDKCLSILDEVILGGVCGQGEEFAWTLLNEIVQQDKQDLRRCLRLALQQWSQAGKLSSSLISLLSTNTTIMSRQQAAWMMLADTAPFTGHINSGFVLDNWKKWVEQDVPMTTENVQIVVAVLTVIGSVSDQLSRVALNDIKDRLLVMLSTFELPVAVVTTVMTTLTLLCHTLTSSQSQYQSLLDSWLEDILHCCEQHVSTLMGLSQGLNEEQLILYLFTLGEVAQLCPAHISPHTGVLIQSLLVATSEAPDIGEGVVLSQEISHFSHLRFSPALRAHAYVTLGKLCLQNEDIAKNSLVLMSRELKYSTQAVIRNNIVVVLCDLAVRYSAKVDPYIPSVAVCLRDPSLLVRKQCLTLLAHLLQEDYIKWKGSLFYQFVSTLIDANLSKLTEFCLVQLLLARQPHMFYHHFIECIFHFNGYQKHRVFNQFHQTDRERELFSLAGPDNSSNRMTIYQFLLSHMTDEHRFQLTTKLCHEVLGGVVDSVIAMEDDSTHLIKDTLAVLTCKDIKLTTLRRSAQEEAAQEGDAFGVVMATAQTKIITQIVKKNALDNIVPIVIATKHLFEKEHSPLLKDLMMYLSELHKDFPAEIKDILTGDPQLADEIEFDLRRFEEDHIAAAAAVPAETPHAQLVSPLLTPQALGPAATGHVALTSPQLRQAPRHDPLAVSSPHLTTAAGSSSPLVREQHVGGVSSPLVTASRAQDGEDDSVRTPIAAPPAGPSSPLPSARPLFTRTPCMPLSRIAVLTSARKTMRALGPTSTVPVSATPAEAVVVNPVSSSDDNTPADGLADSLSFNISSFLSSSPIPVNRSVASYATAGPTPEEEGPSPAADIVMALPDSDTNDEANNLPQWNIQ